MEQNYKSKMWKQFTLQGNTQYLNILPEILKQYNNTKHSSIKMTPVEASEKKNEGSAYFNPYGDKEEFNYHPNQSLKIIDFLSFWE